MHEPDSQPEPDETGDPLLDCLVILGKLQQQPCSGEALRAGLPLVNDRLTPTLFVRAAERVGLSARVVKRPLARVSRMVLPAVLLLHDGQACVLTGLGEGGAAEVMFPETGFGVTRTSLEDLAARYLGYAIFVQPMYRSENRGDEAGAIPRSWFWGTLLRQKGEYLEVVIASLMVNMFALASPLFIQNVYDRVLPNQAFETLWVMVTGVTIAFAFDFLTRTLRAYFLDLAGKKADVLMSSVLFQQVMGMRLKARPASAGALANNLREFESLRDFCTSASLATLIDLPFAVLFIAVIYMVAGPLFWAPLLAIPLVVIVGLLLQIPLTRITRENFSASGEKHGILIEAIDGIETVKAIGAEGLMQSKWEQVVGQTAKTALKSRLISTMAVNFTALTQNLVTVIVVIGGVYQVGAGQLTTGGLIAATILSGRALAPLGQLAALLTRYQHARTALTSLNRVMDLPQERPPGKVFLQRLSLRGEIAFDKVAFTYTGQKMPALEGLSFRVAAGERVGVLGRIGAGKSTVEKLILGLYQPDSGSILIDDTDIGQIDPVDLRSRTGYVTQDASLFFGTVRENITMGSPFADDAAVLRAAELAGADRFANRHPKGLELPIGEQGTGLSGGQRQTVAIARAFLSDPRMLLLDEPTSAMDQNSEQEFIRNMKSFLEGRTLVLATHKPAMLELVDRLIVLDAGKVLLDGPKDRVLQALSQGRQPPDATKAPR